MALASDSDEFNNHFKESTSMDTKQKRFGKDYKMRLPRLLAAMMLAVSSIAFGQPNPTSPKLPFPPPPPGLTLQNLDRLAVSGTPYMTTRAAIRQAAQLAISGTQTIQNTRNSEFRVAGASEEGTASQIAARRLRPRSNFVVFENQLSNDSSRDVEPTTIVQQYGTATYRTTVATKFVGGVPANYFYTTDGSLTWVAGLAGPQPGYNWAGNPGDYHAMGDPYLSENIYTTGIAGKRMYTTGIAFSGTNFVGPTGIAIWSSDDGGRSWSYPSAVASTSSNGVLYDKPSVAVSWYTGSSGVFLGEVYVAYVYARQSGINDIHVARSWNGGLNFFQDVVIASGQALTDPQMLVDGRTGYLYVVWEDFQNPQVSGDDRIWYRSSTDLNHLGQDGYWNAAAIVAQNLNLVNPPGFVNGTRMPTIAMARLNTSAGAINVVWHAFGTDGTPDAVFAYKLPGQPWNVGPLRGANTDNDQFQPALDFDPSGNLIVGYYSRTGLGSTDPRYREYTVLVRYDGTNLRGEEAVSSFYTDPTVEILDGNTGFVGDYHDIWYSPEFAYWFDAWIGRNESTTGWYEVYRSGVY